MNTNATNRRCLWPAAFLLLLLLPGSILAQHSLTQKVDSLGTLRVGQLLPAFALPVAANDIVSRRTLLESERPMLIGFWASWCASCRAGITAVQAWQSGLEDAGLPQPSLLFINVGEKRETIEATRQHYGWTLPLVQDRFGAVAERFGIPLRGNEASRSSLPVTVLADAEGVIRAIYTAEGEDFSRVLDADYRLLLESTLIE